MNFCGSEHLDTVAQLLRPIFLASQPCFQILKADCKDTFWFVVAKEKRGKKGFFFVAFLSHIPFTSEAGANIRQLSELPNTFSIFFGFNPIGEP
jgi:hypothetical protein